MFRTSLLLAMLATAPLALAHEGQPTTAPATQPGNFIDIEWPGGPLPQLLDFVRDMDPKFRFVVFANGVQIGDAEVPPMTLKQVTARQIIDLIRGSDIGVNVDVKIVAEQGNAPIFRVTLEPGPFTPHSNRAQVLRVFSLSQAVDAAVETEMARVKDATREQINKALQEKLDEVLSLVNKTVEIAAPGEKSPQISFHPGTRTLIVRGTPEQLAAIEQLTQALSQAISATQEASQNVKAAVEMLGRRTQDLAAENERLREEIEKLKSEKAKPEAK